MLKKKSVRKEITITLKTLRVDTVLFETVEDITLLTFHQMDIVSMYVCMYESMHSTYLSFYLYIICLQLSISFSVISLLSIYLFLMCLHLFIYFLSTYHLFTTYLSIYLPSYYSSCYMKNGL